MMMGFVSSPGNGTAFYFYGVSFFVFGHIIFIWGIALF